MEREVAQVAAAHLARIAEHGACIQADRAGTGDDLAGGGIAQRHALVEPCLPPAADETLQLHASLLADDLSVDAVGPAAKQRQALAALVGDHHFVQAVAPGAP